MAIIKLCCNGIALFIGVLLLFAAAPGLAIDIVDRTQAEKVMQGNKEDIPLISDEFEGEMDEKHQMVGEYLISAATWFDSFFDNSRSEAEENQSTVRLRLDGGWDKCNAFTEIGLFLKLRPRFLFPRYTGETSIRDLS